MSRAEEFFDLFDERSFAGERVAGDDEGFAGLFGETGQKMLFDRVGPVVQSLKLRGLPETGQGMVCRVCHCGFGGRRFVPNARYRTRRLGAG